MILYHTVCPIHHLFEWKKFFSLPSKNWQISADSAGSGSNLNYRCIIVCSCFFLKIIFRYKSIYFIIDPQIVMQYSTPSYKRSRLPFWSFFEIGIRNSKKIKKIQNLRFVSCYVTKMPGKIIDLEYCKYFKKVFTKRATSFNVAWLSS
jgi:hypothetical protein